MIDFPTATAVHRRLPKEAFYKHLSLTKVLKNKFVSDVDRIIIENSRQLALYHGKLYRTQWMDSSEVNLKPQGFSLDEIWDAFVEQIALYEERAEKTDSLSIDERLTLQEQILKLEKLITKTEAAAWKEQQSKKQFEIYTRLREYKKNLEILKSGKNIPQRGAN